MIKNVPFQLVILFIGLAGTLLLRINVESTGYISPDAEFYLRASDNALAGKGFIAPTTYPFDSSTPESSLAIWPVGYPVLISAVSFLTGLDSFLASKMVNLIFLGLCLVLIYHWFGPNSLLPALVFCSFGLLEVYSYTWSEGPFIFFLLWMMFQLDKMVSLKNVVYDHFLLIFCLVGLVLLRYAGLIYFFYLSALILYFYVRKEYDKAKTLTISLTVASVLVGGYLLHNYLLTGGFFGAYPRVFPEHESWSTFMILLSNGLLNEVFVVRNFYWDWDPLFFVGFTVQIAIIFILYVNRRHFKMAYNSMPFLLIFSASIFYLFAIILLRKLSPFDAFDYRILAPFSAPLLIGLLSLFRFDVANKISLNLKVIIVSFFVFSLAINLPKQFLLEKTLLIFQ